MKTKNQSGAVNFHGASAETEYEFLLRSEAALSDLLSDAIKLGKLELAYMFSMAMLASKDAQKEIVPSKIVRAIKNAA